MEFIAANFRQLPNGGAGSMAARPQSPTAVIFAATPAMQGILHSRVSRAVERNWISRAGPDFIGLHQFLFEGLCPELPGAIGCFRGTGPLRHAKRIVRQRRPAMGARRDDPCLAPQRVPAAMQQLCENFRHMQPGPRGWAKHTHAFFDIHPFLDGNGHVWRVILHQLALSQKYVPTKYWALHQRPYGPEFSFAIQQFRSQPDLLESQLQKFFDLK